MWIKASGEAAQGHQGFRALTATVKAAILEPPFSSFLIYLFLFKFCLPSKIRQRQESHFAFDIAAMAYSGVSACSDSSPFKFVLDTVCLLHFALYLPIIYSLFIYQNLLTFHGLPISPPHIFVHYCCCLQLHSITFCPVCFLPWSIFLFFTPFSLMYAE